MQQTVQLDWCLLTLPEGGFFSSAKILTLLDLKQGKTYTIVPSYY